MSLTHVYVCRFSVVRRLHCPFRCFNLLFSVVLGIFIGVFSVLGYQRHRRSVKSSPQTETELQTTVFAMYDEPEDFKPDPHTEGNLAYGHVQHTGRQQSLQPPTELRGQMYEEIDLRTRV